MDRGPVHCLCRWQWLCSDTALGVSPLYLSQLIIPHCLCHPYPVVEVLCRAGEDLCGFPRSVRNLAVVGGSEISAASRGTAWVNATTPSRLLLKLSCVYIPWLNLFLCTGCPRASATLWCGVSGAGVFSWFGLGRCGHGKPGSH